MVIAVSIRFHFIASLIVNSFSAGIYFMLLVNKLEKLEDKTEPDGTRATETLTKKD